MKVRGAALLGLIALACVGCATGNRMHATNTNFRTDALASPMTSDVQHCEGWFDQAARACDSLGD